MGSYNNLSNVSMYTLKTYRASLLAEINNADHSKLIRDAARKNLNKVETEMNKRNGD